MRFVWICLLFISSGLEGLTMPPRCFEQFQRTFFDEKTISETLALYKVPQAQWRPITRSLTSEGKTVRQRVRALARQRRPNPLTRPFDPEGATKLLKQVVEEIFISTIQTYAPLNGRDGKQMFERIWLIKEEQLNLCIEKNVQKKASLKLKNKKGAICKSPAKAIFEQFCRVSEIFASPHTL